MGSAVKIRRSSVQKALRMGFFSILAFVTVTGSFAQQTYQVSTCSGTDINFQQPGAVTGTTYTWTLPVYNPATAITGGTAQLSPQNSVIQTLGNNTTAAGTATYVVSPSTGAPFQLVVTVNPLPVLSSNTTPGAICSGTAFNYQPASATAGTNITWSRVPVTGISNNGATGTNNPNEILNNITTSPITVNYVFALTASGCKNNNTVSVTVNPTPFLSSSLTPPAVCSGSNFSYTPSSTFSNTSFSWTRAVVNGISNGSSSGTGNPNEILVNTTLLPVTVVYTYTLTSAITNCVGTQAVSVVVNPVPSVAAQNVSICSGNTFMVSPGTAPVGTLYTWSTPVITSGSISGGSAVSVGQLYVGQALINNGAGNATALYTVTPNTAGCTGANFNVTVTVTAAGTKAVLTSSLTPPDICSGSIFNYQPLSNTTGTNFAWQRFAANGISTAPNSGTNNPNEMLVNGSTLPVVVNYAFTLTANGCSNTQDVQVRVNPTPVLNTTLTPVPICSNTLFSYVPASNTPGTSFTWTRSAVAGITNAAASGTGNPAETLVNATTQPVSVTYIFSLITANGCTNSQAVTLLVNPSPKLSSVLNPPAICGGSKFNYTPLSSTTGAVFTWNRSLVPSISNGVGSGTNDPAEILVNTGTVAVPVPYIFHILANSCNTDQVVTVLVNPTPMIADQSVTICSNTAFSITPVNVPPVTQYTWTNPVINPAGSVSGASAQTIPQAGISQQLNNQTLNPATVTYTVRPVAGSCTGVDFMITVTVNPVPVIANQSVAGVCSGTPFTYTPANVPTGTTYTWTNPVMLPVNSLTGGSAQPISQAVISQTLSSVNNTTNTATYTVTPTAYNCMGSQFTISVPVNPVPAINNLSDTICSGSSFFTAPAPVPSNTLYTWGAPANFPFGSIIGGSAQVVPASNISQTLINTTSATAQTVYTVTPTAGSCRGTSFTLTITVGVPLPFTPNQSALICSGTTFDATPVTSRPGTTYTWTIPTVTPAGTISGISAATVPQSAISQLLTNLGSVTDTVVYTVQPYSTGCRGNIFTATIRVIALPKATITGNPVICRYPYDTLTVSFTGIGPWSFTYLNDTIPGMQTGITTSPYKWIVPKVPGISSRTVRIISVRDVACFNNVDSAVFVQKINPLPVGFITSLHGIYLCNNIADTLFVSSFNTDTLRYQWTLNGSPITGAVTDSIATLQPGRYNALLTNQYGCMDTVALAASLILITQPVLKFRYDSYCINTPVNFTNLTDTLTTGMIQWLWDFGDSNTATTYHSTNTYLKGGDHHVRLTATQAFCPSTPTSTDSTLNIQFPIAGLTMPSVSAYKGLFTPIAARSLPGYRYRWVPSKGIEQPDSASTRFNLSATQQYLVNLISPGGCITMDTVLVRVFDDKLVDILVPRSFTPNGDGVNDILYPYHTGIQTFKYFRVFNRFGKLMFETTNPDAGWNGMVNGTQQPMAIYIWVAAGIANDGSMVEKKGETLLLR